MRTRSAGLSRVNDLLQAIFAGEHGQLRALLNGGSVEDLSTQPFSLFHAAAAAGDAEAIRLLAAAGAPIEAANQLASLSPEVIALLPTGDAEQRAALRLRSSALCIAARLCLPGAAAALLQAGADATVGTGQSSALNSLGTWLSSDRVEATVRALLAGGVPVTQCRMVTVRGMMERHPAAGSLLLTRLHEASLAGSFAMPANHYNAQHLLWATVLADATDVLEHFASRLLPGQVTPVRAQRLLCRAASNGSMGVLRLAAAAANAPAAHTGAAARLLGPHFHSSAAAMLQGAAAADAAASVQLIINEGQAPTLSAVLTAVRGGNAAALRAMLAVATPEVPPALQLGAPGSYNDAVTKDSLHSSLEVMPCPILAALHTRIIQHSSSFIDAAAAHAQPLVRCSVPACTPPYLRELLTDPWLACPAGGAPLGRQAAARGVTAACSGLPPCWPLPQRACAPQLGRTHRDFGAL